MPLVHYALEYINSKESHHILFQWNFFRILLLPAMMEKEEAVEARGD